MKHPPVLFLNKGDVADLERAASLINKVLKKPDGIVVHTVAASEPDPATLKDMDYGHWVGDGKEK